MNISTVIVSSSNISAVPLAQNVVIYMIALNARLEKVTSSIEHTLTYFSNAEMFAFPARESSTFCRAEMIRVVLIQLSFSFSYHKFFGKCDNATHLLASFKFVLN